MDTTTALTPDSLAATDEAVRNRPGVPFALIDDDGDVWRLSAADAGGGYTELRLTLDEMLCEEAPYRVEALCLIRADGTRGSHASPPTFTIWTADRQTPLPRRTLNHARAKVEQVVASAAAVQMFPVAVAVAKLPVREKMQVYADTEIALATPDALRAEIARLSERLEPGGFEDQAEADVVARLTAVRPNSGRHRRWIQELHEELAARRYWREETARQLHACHARLAELGE